MVFKKGGESSAISSHRNNQKELLFFKIKSEEPLKNIITCHVPYLGGDI
jgi:hypothetical protein